MLNLNTIAATLESLEETIISKLIDRAQFRINKAIYNPGKSNFIGIKNKSLFELRLSHQEHMDSLFGRFLVPEERPFCKKLPKPRRKMLLPETHLSIQDYNAVNLTENIKSAYLNLVPEICIEGDDGHYGSSVEHDVYALQAIARRIHYGSLYVAECKYREKPVIFNSAIRKGDLKELEKLITRRTVENKILERIKDKVTCAQATVNRNIRKVIDPRIIFLFYRDSVIPLTKKGEVKYLQQRKRSKSMSQSVSRTRKEE